MWYRAQHRRGKLSFAPSTFLMWQQRSEWTLVLLLIILIQLLVVLSLKFGREPGGGTESSKHVNHQEGQSR